MPGLAVGVQVRKDGLELTGTASGIGHNAGFGYYSQVRAMVLTIIRPSLSSPLPISFLLPPLSLSLSLSLSTCNSTPPALLTTQLFSNSYIGEEEPSVPPCCVLFFLHCPELMITHSFPVQSISDDEMKGSGPLPVSSME